MVAARSIREAQDTRLFMGIDGGGTRCRAVVSALRGKVLGRGDAGPANIWSDRPLALANIRAAAERALVAAGRPSAWSEVHAVLGLAGANLPQALSRLDGLPPFAQARIETDAMIALKGALGDADGVGLVTGTGSVFGVQKGGRVRFIGGWGFRLGDQASGANMGRELLIRALLAHDGLVPCDPLLREVVEEAGGPEALVARMADAPAADHAAYLPRILKAAEEGQPASRAILAEADQVLAHAIEVLAEGRPNVPVCFLGGIGPVFAERLAPIYSGRIRPPAGSALDGALALARGMV
jgi:glucosamine kinase